MRECVSCVLMGEFISDTTACAWPRRVLTFILCFRGGVRGLVELTILQAIEKELGGFMRVQDFFDLIVGTR